MRMMKMKWLSLLLPVGLLGGCLHTCEDAPSPRVVLMDGIPSEARLELLNHMVQAIHDRTSRTLGTSIAPQGTHPAIIIDRSSPSGESRLTYNRYPPSKSNIGPGVVTFEGVDKSLPPEVVEEFSIKTKFEWSSTCPGLIEWFENYLRETKNVEQTSGGDRLMAPPQK